MNHGWDLVTHTNAWNLRPRALRSPEGQGQGQVCVCVALRRPLPRGFSALMLTFKHSILTLFTLLTETWCRPGFCGHPLPWGWGGVTTLSAEELKKSRNPGSPGQKGRPASLEL